MRGLIDDAAIFPPGNAPLARAVTEHRAHRRSGYAELVGPLLVGDRRLPELDPLLDAGTRLDTGVVVTGGAGAIEPALVWAGRNDRIELRTVEIALRDEPDPARNAQRISTMLSTTLPDAATASIEVPRIGDDRPDAGWFAALDEIAASGHRMKYRTGGDEASAFPSDKELAAVISAALDRELEFKCTAGLHHAVRHTAADTGFEHHRFLNVILATRAALDGATDDDVAAILGERDGETVAARIRTTGETALASARRWFVSFGSCSIHEPLDDLSALGLDTWER
ncbi:MAG: hypothetical protein GEU93_17030 [Propionibacteriales bacterium]|nr:hypothetical protein [Propionibacteriales bacterium]